MQALSSVQGYLMFVVWTNDTPMPTNVLQSEIKIIFHLLICFIEHCELGFCHMEASCVLFKNQKSQGPSAI